ncbi:hypothetical protein NQZ68_030729 [Dissostichus eleginoides]|nr:hypothetical protein NQZ68_030729 [Dissostichus eleginoides]
MAGRPEIKLGALRAQSLVFHSTQAGCHSGTAAAETDEACRCLSSFNRAFPLTATIPPSCLENLRHRAFAGNVKEGPMCRPQLQGGGYDGEQSAGECFPNDNAPQIWSPNKDGRPLLLSPLPENTECSSYSI